MQLNPGPSSLEDGPGLDQKPHPAEDNSEEHKAHVNLESTSPPELSVQTLMYELGQHQKKLRHVVDHWIQDMQGILENACAHPEEPQATIGNAHSSSESKAPSPRTSRPRPTYGNLPVVEADDKDLGFSVDTYERLCSDEVPTIQDDSSQIRDDKEQPETIRLGEEGFSRKRQQPSSSANRYGYDDAWAAQSTPPLHPKTSASDGTASGDIKNVRPTLSTDEPEIINLPRRRPSIGAESTCSSLASSMASADFVSNHLSTASRRTRMTIDNRVTGVVGSASLIAKTSSVLKFERRKTRGLAELMGHRHLYVLNCKCSMLLSKIVMSHHFESLCAVVIFSNAIIMGIGADDEMKNRNGPKNPVLKKLEISFCMFYTVEVSFRIAVYGKEFFVGRDWKWNWFDSVLILMALSDLVQEMALSDAGNMGAASNLSFLRMLRLFKMLKLLRMIRLMKMFRELRLILYSMLGSMQAMLWASLLVIIISYMVGICFTVGCTGYLQDIGDDVDTLTAERIEEYWSSVGRSMLSLFKSTTGGLEWTRLAAPLIEVGALFYALFIIYVAFFLFVVMNTLTSLFVDAVMEHSSKDQQMIIQMELEKKDQYIVKLQAFFDEIDEDGDGVIGLGEFLKNCDNPVLHAFASSLEIDITNAKQFFHILSNGGTIPVNVETFVVGCIKLKGQARSMDLMDLIHTTKNMSADIARWENDASEKLSKIFKLLNKRGSLERSNTMEFDSVPRRSTQVRRSNASRGSTNVVTEVTEEAEGGKPADVKADVSLSL